MRVLRAKLVRRHLKFYKLVFGVDAPYHVSNETIRELWYKPL